VPQPTINYRARASIESRAHAQVAKGKAMRRVFAVVLGAPSNDGRFVAGRQLIDYGFH